MGIIADHVCHHDPRSLAKVSNVDVKEVLIGMGNDVSSSLKDVIDDGVDAMLAKQDGFQEAHHDSTPTGPRLSLNAFDVVQVLEHGTLLLASGGEEYANESAASLEEQRANLKSRLGLAGGAGMFISTADMFDDADLVEKKSNRHDRSHRDSTLSQREGTAATDLLATMAGQSVREQASALLKAKAAKRKFAAALEPNSESMTKKRKEDLEGQSVKDDPDSMKGCSGRELDAEYCEKAWQAVLAGEWPFQSMCDRLLMDLLHPIWEIRHGAALGLREILRSQAGSAGVFAPLGDAPGGWTSPGTSGLPTLGKAVQVKDVKRAIRKNEEWLEDCCVHLVCALALDRFGDFLADQVVAPVRETAAQALGTASCRLNRSAALLLMKALGNLSISKHWEPRHGGLQGLKYVLASREVDMDFLQAALPSCMAGLGDVDDDVRAVAAEALLPAAGLLGTNSDPEVHRAISLVWDALLADDPLSPAVKGATSLLAAIYTQAASNSPLAISQDLECKDEHEKLDEEKQYQSEDLTRLTPRLWRHLHHQLSSVRSSSNHCLASLLESHPLRTIVSEKTMVHTARLLFQRLILETDDGIRDQVLQSWSILIKKATRHMLESVFDDRQLSAFFTLGSLPANAVLPPSLLLDDVLEGYSDISGLDDLPSNAHNETATFGDPSKAASTRLVLSHALGLLAFAFDGAKTTTNRMVPYVTSSLQSVEASRRIFAAYIIVHWSREFQSRTSKDCRGLVEESSVDFSTTSLSSRPLPPTFISDMIETIVLPTLSQPLPIFKELEKPYTTVRRNLKGLVVSARNVGIDAPPPESIDRMRADDIVSLIDGLAERCYKHETLSKSINFVRNAVSHLQTSETVMNTTVKAAFAAATIAGASTLPSKLNALIQPLIAAVRREPQHVLQREAADALAHLVLLVSSRTPSPTDKIIKNVCAFACGDSDIILDATKSPSLDSGAGDGSISVGGAVPDGAVPQTSVSKGKKRQPQPSHVEIGAENLTGAENVLSAAGLARRGAEEMLKSLVGFSGRHSWTMLPGLWQNMIQIPLREALTTTSASATPDSEQVKRVQGAINGLRVLEIVADRVEETSLQHVLKLLVDIVECLQRHGNKALILASARAIASIASTNPIVVMPRVLEVIVPLLSSNASSIARLGGVVILKEIVTVLDVRMVPYVKLAVVPLLGRMSDADELTRSLASRCFAHVVSLVPLAQGLAPPPGLSVRQLEMLEKDGGFLVQLLDNAKLDDVKIPFHFRHGATLRRYQQEGINWLDFLRRFGLHGVLADDMGVGKTLQATSILAIAICEARKANKDIDVPPSLIVCPSTLVAHWPHEIAKFVEEELLLPLQYSGNPTERARLRGILCKHNVVVTSYDVLRSDIGWLSQVKWLYCILDEGHAIRNPTSKIATAARSIEAQHRLILSGTPIQNSVLELWALFDFLMPGFLGNHRVFYSKYCKALAASRSAASFGRRSSSKAEAEAGVLALESLHRQVMPFVLRRTKDQVLSDLPPKTIQDIVCDLSPLQRILYEDFVESQAMASITGAVQKGEIVAGKGSASSSPHIFQALHYLRKLCSHPLLVLDPSIDMHKNAMRKVLGQGADNWSHAQKSIKSHLSHAPKLAALSELLIDAGIGTEPVRYSGSDVVVGMGRESDVEDGQGADDAGHRALVFSQNRAMLDLVETSVLIPLRISFLRIDGSVDAAERFRRVQQFNADPTIGVMLLTTSVGGLGLNLTAADTVVFLEHDWNPQKDLQAMDRAHRLGQRRAVNVYRLLMRGTLEERIMSLQKFKLDVAETVVNTENVSLGAMDTGNLLDLFVLEEGKEAGGKAGKGRAQGNGKQKAGSGVAAILAEMPDPEKVESQYGEEFDLDEFRKRLKKD